MTELRVAFVALIESGPGKDRELQEALMELTAASRQEADCLAYVLHRVESDPRRFLLYEVFADKAAHLLHMQQLHFLAFQAKRESDPHLIQGIQVENLSIVLD